MSVLGVWALSITALAQEPPRGFAIRDVRVFDGVEVHDRVTVVVADGLIQSVGDDPVPVEFPVVDGSGQTLLPGLIEAHNHYDRPALQTALSFGVTTALNMSGPPAGELRREQASGGGINRADVFSADRMAAAGRPGVVRRLLADNWQGSVITSTDEAEAFVADRVAEGSDYIKIVYEADDVGARPMLRAVIEAAHRVGKLTVVHALEQRTAVEAIEDGANGLVHIFGDEEPDPAFATLVADRGVFVVPTLFIHDSSHSPQPRGRIEHAAEAVRQLRALGVPILAGSDGAPGDIHRELELLFDAGLSPREALVAATSATAQSFGLEDRGRVAPGYRADLLLVRGDPTVDILATLDIVQVWKLGVPAALPTQSPAAHALYLRALSATTPESFRSAINQVIALDPEFALAYARRAANDTIRLVGVDTGLAPDEALELERAVYEDAERALSIDPTLGAAHAALAAVHQANWRGTTAEQAFQRAVELSPNDVDVLVLYGRFKRYRGEYEEAIRLKRRAIELDPNVFYPYVQLAITYSYAADWDAAAAAFEGHLNWVPGNIDATIQLGLVEASRGNAAEAVRLLQLTEQLGQPPLFRLAQMAHAYALAGRPDDAARLFAEFEERATEERVGEGWWAHAYIAVDNYGQALQRIESAVNERVSADQAALAILAANPWGDPELDKPEFRELLDGLWDE